MKELITLFTFITLSTVVPAQKSPLKKPITKQPARKASVSARQDLARDVFFYLNIHRVVRGRSPLYYNSSLQQAADFQSRYCADINRMAHNNPAKNRETALKRVLFFKAPVSSYREHLFRSENFRKKILNNRRRLAYHISYWWYYSFDGRDIVHFGRYNLAGIGISERKTAKGAVFFLSMVLGKSKKNSYYHRISYRPRTLYQEKNPISYTRSISGNVVRFVISYQGPYRPGVIQLKGDGPITRHRLNSLQKQGIYEYIKKRDHGRYVYITLTDPASGIEYPVLNIW